MRVNRAKLSSRQANSLTGRDARPAAAQRFVVRRAVETRKNEKSEQKKKNCLDSAAFLLYNRGVATQLS